MGKEIERKYLVVDRTFKNYVVETHHIVQGYLSKTPEATVRVRIIDKSNGYLTVKGLTIGAVRGEWEYEIPVNEAVELLELSPRNQIIDKIRHIVYHDNFCWEVDEFIHPCKGLVLAEIELTREDEVFTVPPFIGLEVTDNPKYYNSNLANNCEPV